MKPLIMLVIRGEEGTTRNLPFVFRDGNLIEIVEGIADYIAGNGLECAFWEGIAADRLRIILEQQRLLDDSKALLQEANEGLRLLREHAGALAQ